MFELRGRSRLAGLALFTWVAVRFAAASAGSAGEMLQLADRARPLDEGRLRLAFRGAGDREPAAAEIELLLDGKGSFLAIFRSGKQAGRRILHIGDRSWLILPTTKRPVPLSGQARLSGLSFLADIADLRLARDFTGTLRAVQETRDGVPCDVVDLRAARAGTAWPAGTLWIGARDRLPREIRLRVASGREARSIEMQAFGEERGHRVARRMAVRDLLRKDQAAPGVVEVLESQPGAVDPSTFTLDGARALR
jgi:hypothetical protein